MSEPTGSASAVVADGPAFPMLFSPLPLGPLRLRNRILLSPMTTGFGFDQGAPDDDLLAYFRARSHGVALAVVAFGAVSPEGRVEQKIPWMWRPDAGRALAPLATAIHEAGALAALQLGHGGRQVSPRVTGQAPVAPSPLPPAVHVVDVPVALSTGEVEAIVEAFAVAAARAAEAGFDAVELHAAHGYLVQQFLSAESNHRDDRFGGATVAERATFGAAVASAIRDAAAGLALLVRINGDDLIAGGLTPADAQVVATRFIDAGAHGVVVSAGVYGSVPYTIPLLDDPEGTFLDAAAAVKAAVDVPVVAVGRITDPATAERALVAGRCDAVALGRALLADPDWVEKAAAGSVAEIRPCIATVQGCAGMLQSGEPISCSVNPDVGRERRRVPAVVARRDVLVVGGGPAGMETARRAAELGHRVRLVERADHLGGAVALAARTPGLAHLARLVRWYEGQLARVGVTVELSAEATDAQLDAADVVVSCVGAETEVPPLDGYDELDCWTAEGYLAGAPSTLDRAAVPERVVVVGAGQRGLAVALRVIADGARVELVTDDGIGADTSGLTRRAYLARLSRAGVAPLRATLAGIDSGGIRIHTADGEQVIEAGGLVLAGRMRPRPGPSRPSAARIGDGREPRDIAAAVAEGRDLAERIPLLVGGAGPTR